MACNLLLQVQQKVARGFSWGTCSFSPWKTNLAAQSSRKICAFTQNQSVVGAALCRAHSKTPWFFRRHALESIAMADTNPLAQTPRPVERTRAQRCQLAGPTGQLQGHRHGGPCVTTPASQGHRRHQGLSGCRNATGQHGVARWRTGLAAA